MHFAIAERKPSEGQMIAVPGERQLLVQSLNLLKMPGVEEGRASDREPNRMAHKRFVLTNAAEKVERLVEDRIPLNRVDDVIEPFAIGDDFEIVERIRVLADEAGENRVEDKPHTQLRRGLDVGLSRPERHSRTFV